MYHLQWENRSRFTNWQGSHGLQAGDGRLLIGKLRWGEIIQRAVWSIMIVFMLPGGDDFELAEAVNILLPDRDALNYLVENGWDLDHNVSETDAGITVTVIATPSELAFLQEMGIVVLETEFDQQAWEAVTAERPPANT